MPELPEVEAITSVVARYSIGQRIEMVDVVRQPANNAYFGGVSPLGTSIKRVYRRGKHVLMELSHDWTQPPYDRGAWIDCHNAMTGYWDYEDEPWSFDYVEGARDADDHVRVRMGLSNGRVLRFHDARFFGRLAVVGNDGLPRIGPELLETPFGRTPIITLQAFAESVLSDRRPIKQALMDQNMVAGIGNIYASEGCHLAGVDPHTPGRNLRPDQVPILLEALRCVVSHSIPTVTYQWLNVYRRDRCGSCGGFVTRTEVAKRATFMCNRCQGEPRHDV